MQTSSDSTGYEQNGAQYKAPEVSKTLFAEVYDTMKARPAFVATLEPAVNFNHEGMLFTNIWQDNTSPPAKSGTGDTRTSETSKAAKDNNWVKPYTAETRAEMATTVNIDDLKKMTEEARLGQQKSVADAHEKSAIERIAADDLRLSQLAQLAIEAAKNGQNGVNLLLVGISRGSSAPSLNYEQQRVFNAIRAMGFNPTIEQNSAGLAELEQKQNYKGSYAEKLASDKNYGNYYLRAEW